MEPAQEAFRLLATSLAAPLAEQAPVLPGIDSSAYQSSAQTIFTLHNGIATTLTSPFAVTPIPGPDTSALRQSEQEVKIAMANIKAELEGAVLPTLKLPGIEMGEVPDKLIAPEFAQKAAEEAKAREEARNAELASMKAGQQEAIQAQADFNTAFEELASAFPAGALAEIGVAIGTALADGGNVMAEVRKAILKSLADFGMKLGQQLLLMGAADIASGVFAAKGFAEIAAGTALIIGSAALGSGKGAAKAGGGAPPRPPAPSSFAPPAVRSAPPAATSTSPVTVIHQVQMVQRGADLMGSLLITNNRMGRVLGNGSPIVTRRG